MNHVIKFSGAMKPRRKHIDWLTIMLIAAVVMVVCTLVYAKVFVWL